MNSRTDLRTNSRNVIVLLSELLMSRTTIRLWIQDAIDDISKNFRVLFVFHYRSKIFYKISLVTCNKIYIFIYFFFFENLFLHRYDIFSFKTRKKIILTSFNFPISCTISHLYLAAFNRDD